MGANSDLARRSTDCVLRAAIGYVSPASSSRYTDGKIYKNLNVENMQEQCWSIQEIESLIDQVVGNKKLPDIYIPGKSEAAVNNQRRRLKEAGRLGGVFTGRTLKPWTICELNELRNFTNEYGFSAHFISQLQLVAGRSKDSVSGMMHRQGLGNVTVRARAKQARRLTEEQREELKLFLLGEGRLMLREGGKAATPSGRLAAEMDPARNFGAKLL